MTLNRHSFEVNDRYRTESNLNNVFKEWYVKYSVLINFSKIKIFPLEATDVSINKPQRRRSVEPYTKDI